MKNKVIRIWLAGSVFLLANSCGTSPEPLYYRLSSLAPSAEPGRSQDSVFIRVGPITIPEELDRSSIVTQIGTNRVDLAEYHRWAGNLQSAIGRVLGENLSALLPGSRISLEQEVSLQPIDVQITVNIREFGGRLGEAVKLSADWTVIRFKDKKSIRAKKSILEEKTQSRDYASFVAAQSRLLARLSRSLAQEIE